MRSPIFTKPVQVYFPPQLIEAARAKAVREGCTVSELMRSALRNELRDAA